MIKVKKVTQISSKYEIQLEEDETFNFELVFDREEWVLQGGSETLVNNRGCGVRYSQAELSSILKIIKELNLRL